MKKQNVIAEIKSNQVTYLELSNLNIDSKQAVELADALKNNTSIRHIDLSENKIGYLGYQAIWKMLRINKTIQTINIENNLSITPNQMFMLRTLWMSNDDRTQAIFDQIAEPNKLNRKPASILNDRTFCEWSHELPENELPDELPEKNNFSI